MYDYVYMNDWFKKKVMVEFLKTSFYLVLKPYLKFEVEEQKKRFYTVQIVDHNCIFLHTTYK